MALVGALAAAGGTSGLAGGAGTAGPDGVLTARTCAGDTCQVVDGSGTDVTSWYTSTTAPSSVCTHAQWRVNGTVVGESGTTCLGAGQSASATWNDPGTFASGSRLCTTWTGIPGTPCDTVG